MLGKDQSPATGQSATTSTPRTARHGRSSSTTSFSASLTAYATTVPTPTSTTPATHRALRRRTAAHPTHASSTPRTTKSPSATRSIDVPAHEGASAITPLTARYTATEAPPVTSTGPAFPSPPG
ncbi:hypothetical protein ACFV2X_19535 [Streptomyces sp. NPDC059679]|uniref:hypothetical protein n=1 Tax=Streptomyces sp. NPDC059679 TaxID=3346903 RepID=UPI0036B6859B